MICPHCHVEYEGDASCFCHPAPQMVAAAMEVAKPAIPEDRLAPTGLNNPFWKPEAVPPAVSATQALRRGRPGFSA